MAIGIELVLGFEFSDISLIRSASGVSIGGLAEQQDETGIRAAIESGSTSIGREVNGPLLDAWKAAASEMGWELLSRNCATWKYNTPVGERFFLPWSFEWFYEPVEFDEKIETSICGVAVSGRYFPTFLDWREPDGGLWNVVVDPAPPEVQIAKRHIVEAIPWFESAKWIARLRSY